MESHILTRFEQEEVWSQGYVNDPAWMSKYYIMRGMIPDNITTILDVGCGNCRQMDLLSLEYQIVGVDISQTALRFGSGKRCRAWSHHLPIESASFDLVISSQLIEHLDKQVLHNTVSEMQRVTREWLLISVPYRENLLFRQSRCHSCGKLFHIYGHKQYFDLRNIRNVFAPLRITCWAIFGPPRIVYHPLLLYLKRWVGGCWYSYPPAKAVCPQCGHKEQEAWHGNRISYYCDKLNRIYTKCIRINPTPRWIAILAQKKTKNIFHDA